MPAVMRLSDVEFAKAVFEPGDRVIARISCDLRADQCHKIMKSINKAAKVPLRVFFADCRKVTVRLIRNGNAETLVSPLDIEAASNPAPGVINLSLAVVRLLPTDVVEVGTTQMDLTQHKRWMDSFRHWAGNVEVRLAAGLSAL